MRKQKIYPKAWLDLHNRARQLDSDGWYIGLANDLLGLLEGSRFLLSASCPHAAIVLALYMEDCIADGGDWRKFVRLHRQRYHRCLPFYNLSESYLDDEINPEDIALLLWMLQTEHGVFHGTVPDPCGAELLALANAAYAMLDRVFEEAPVSDGLAKGWLLFDDWMERERVVVPQASLADSGRLPKDVVAFLQATGGHALRFFDSYAALRCFFVESLHWEDNDDALLPGLRKYSDFVLYANPKGLLVAPDVAACFADAENLLYSPQKASEEAYRLFVEPGLCPFDLLKYGMEQHLLPDAQFPFANGKTLLQENWDFVARWLLRDYYEGD